MPDFDAERWNKIVSAGAFAQSVAIALDTSHFTVSGFVGKGFARKEVDGRLTTEEPLGTVSFMIRKSALPPIITKDAYYSLLFTIDEQNYSVANWTGHSTLRFFLKSTAKEFEEEPPEGYNPDGTVVSADDQDLGDFFSNVGTIGENEEMEL